MYCSVSEAENLATLIVATYPETLESWARAAGTTLPEVAAEVREACLSALETRPVPVGTSRALDHTGRWWIGVVIDDRDDDEARARVTLWHHEPLAEPRDEGYLDVTFRDLYCGPRPRTGGPVALHDAIKAHPARIVEAFRAVTKAKDEATVRSMLLQLCERWYRRRSSDREAGLQIHRPVRYGLHLQRNDDGSTDLWVVVGRTVLRPRIAAPIRRRG